jgi:hypothetical protein
MLPATTVARPEARQSAPVSSVTVDLPFEPVTASTFCSGGSARAKSSMSPTSSAPQATAAANTGLAPATLGQLAAPPADPAAAVAYAEALYAHGWLSPLPADTDSPIQAS